MTTNFNHIINDNLDMFDFDRTEEDISNIVFPADKHEMMFDIINKIDFVENDMYCYGWRYEYIKDGVTELGQVHFYDGAPEDCAEQFGGKMENFFWMPRLNGWKPTGKVWFAGYFEEHWGVDDEGDFGEYYTDVQLFPAPDDVEGV